jgi:soluble lytic murein transglycosylase-like protein
MPRSPRGAASVATGGRGVAARGGRLDRRTGLTLAAAALLALAALVYIASPRATPTANSDTDLTTAAVEPKAVAPSGLALIGTVIGTGAPVALIKRDARVERLRQGQVLDGWMVTAIRADCVVLERDGRQLALKPGEKSATSKAATCAEHGLLPRRESYVAGPVSVLLRRPAVRRAGEPWSDFVEEAAARLAMPAAWIREVMQIESGGHAALDGLPVVSRAGAMGLMQVMPTTYDALRTRYGLGADPFDPHDNILAGAAYIREMYDLYGAPGFLAAYNAGPGRMNAYLTGARALPDETEHYLARLAPAIAGFAPGR